jgi:hypothetical protein
LHPLAVEGWEHQSAAREEFLAGKAEYRPGAEEVAETKPESVDGWSAMIGV